MPPKVTVLMPVHNGLPYLQMAMESVLNQTFTDFEFLVIDDASTDDSISCIRSYGDSRIRLVCNEYNLGTSRTINRGLDLARTGYIARLDQDDVCLPERLEKQLALLEQRPDVALVCSWEYSIDSHGRKIRSWWRELDDYGAFLGYLLVGKSPIWHPSIMFRREAVVDVGGYQEPYAPAEDFELSMRLALRRYNATVVPEFLVMQRDHGSRQSVKRASAQWKKTQQCHNEMIKTYCPTVESELVAKFLRMPTEAVIATIDAADIFWAHCKTKQQLGAVLHALDNTLSNMQTRLGLSTEEFGTLKRLVYARLGPGARLGTKLLFLPSMLFYPLFFSLSPMLLPKVRRVLSCVHATFCELRYPGRFIQSGLERWVDAKR